MLCGLSTAARTDKSVQSRHPQFPVSLMVFTDNITPVKDLDAPDTEGAMMQWGPSSLLVFWGTVRLQ